MGRFDNAFGYLFFDNDSLHVKNTIQERKCLIKLGLHLILILQAVQDMRFLIMLWRRFSGLIYF